MFSYVNKMNRIVDPWIRASSVYLEFKEKISIYPQYVTYMTIVWHRFFKAPQRPLTLYNASFDTDAHYLF